MSATVFDRMALCYDDLWTSTAIGRAQRNAVWRAVDPLFPAGARILDIGCGTGEDAAHFTARGVIVTATGTLEVRSIKGPKMFESGEWKSIEITHIE